MKVNWSRELFTGALYFLFSFVAATAALSSHAAHDYGRANDLNDGLISCFAYSEVLKGAGVFYGWLPGSFIAFWAARFLILFAVSGGGTKLPEALARQVRRA